MFRYSCSVAKYRQVLPQKTNHHDIAKSANIPYFSASLVSLVSALDLCDNAALGWSMIVSRGPEGQKKKKPVTEEQSRARTQYNIFSINFPWNKMRGGAEPSGRRQFGRVSCTMYLFHPLICRNNLGSNLKQLRLYERF